MDLKIRDFTINDYDAAINLWQTDEGIGLSSADRRENIAQFLKRNPSQSKVIVDGETVIATILCGHDGRRGYLYHLFVREDYRRKGLGTRLTDAALDVLMKKGIRKCHLFVMGDNDSGKKFWEAGAWKERVDIVIFSKDI